MPKFLIIRFSSIGDIIQCMGIIGGIREKFPEAEIHWITRKDMSSFLAMDKRINKIRAFDKARGLKGLLQMGRELRKEHFDYIYDAHSNIRSNILKLQLKPLFWQPLRITYRSKERIKRILLFRFGINRFEWPFRGMVSYRKPLRKWGITDFPDNYSDWYFPEDFGSRLHPFIAPNTVTLIPSANWKKKRWPISHWQRLVELLPDHHFLILAGPADTFCEQIRAISPERIINLAGKTSLLESCYLVCKSHVVISADTGFLHAADLFHTPALALMGPTAFGFPTHTTSEIIGVDLPCRPCTKDGRGKCKRRIFQQCMVDITPERIAARVSQLLPVKP